jgi:hypothetical protein
MRYPWRVIFLALNEKGEILLDRSKYVSKDALPEFFDRQHSIKRMKIISALIE